MDRVVAELIDAGCAKVALRLSDLPPMAKPLLAAEESRALTLAVAYCLAALYEEVRWPLRAERPALAARAEARISRYRASV